MPFCNTYADYILNTLLSGTKYLALMNGDPTQSGLLTQEMAGDGYVRKPVTFTTASGRSVANSDVVWWAELPDTPIRYIAVCTALTGGSVICYRATGSDIYIVEGKRFVLSAGDLAFTVG
jgi:hypothetical protein